MKWPNQLVLVRHGQSQYNELKERKDKIAGYRDFRELYAEEWAGVTSDMRTALRRILAGEFPSRRLRELALEVLPQLNLGVSDYDLRLTPLGWEQARLTGAALPDRGVHLPDVIYVSPYRRTRETLDGLMLGWPELGRVKTTVEERIREQEHGMRAVYSDWRIYNIFHPEEALLEELNGDYVFRHQGGESHLDVRERSASVLAMLTREHPGDHVLLVTHHLVIFGIKGKLERWDREKFIKEDEAQLHNCGVTTFQGHPEMGTQGRLVCDRYNDKLYAIAEE